MTNDQENRMSTVAGQTVITADGGTAVEEPKPKAAARGTSYTVLASIAAGQWEIVSVVEAASQAAARKAAVTSELIEASQSGKTVELVAVAGFDAHTLKVEQPELRIRA